MTETFFNKKNCSFTMTSKLDKNEISTLTFDNVKILFNNLSDWDADFLLSGVSKTKDYLGDWHYLQFVHDFNYHHTDGKNNTDCLNSNESNFLLASFLCLLRRIDEKNFSYDYIKANCDDKKEGFPTSLSDIFTYRVDKDVYGPGNYEHDIHIGFVFMSRTETLFQIYLAINHPNMDMCAAFMFDSFEEFISFRNSFENFLRYILFKEGNKIKASYLLKNKNATNKCIKNNEVLIVKNSSSQKHIFIKGEKVSIKVLSKDKEYIKSFSTTPTYIKSFDSKRNLVTFTFEKNSLGKEYDETYPLDHIFEIIPAINGWDKVPMEELANKLFENVLSKSTYLINIFKINSVDCLYNTYKDTFFSKYNYFINTSSDLFKNSFLYGVDCHKEVFKQLKQRALTM